MESKAELRSLSEIALLSSWSSFWRCPGSGRGGVESEYTITVERATREIEGEGEEDEEEEEYGEEEYDIIGSHGSSLNEIKDAVQCFLDEGGSLNSFAEYKLEK